MTPQEYANKLVREYENIFNEEIVTNIYNARYNNAAIKCAIKQIEAEINLAKQFPADYEILPLDESLTHLKSLIL